MAYFRVTTVFMFVNIKTNLPYCMKIRSIDRFLSLLRLRDKLRAKSSPFFYPSYRFPDRDLLRIHQALLPRGIGIEYRSIPDTRILDKSPGSTYGKRRNKDFVVLQSACGALCASFVASSKPLYVCIFFRTNFLLNPI